MSKLGSRLIKAAREGRAIVKSSKERCIMFIDDKAAGETPSFTGFAKFLAEQDPNATYNWSEPDRCACAQYLRSIGCYSTNWLKTDMLAMNELARGPKVYPDALPGQPYFRARGWTFGGCLERTKAALATKL